MCAEDHVKSLNKWRHPNDRSTTENFDIEMGRFHEKPVGPHPMWSYQVAFKPSQFDALIPWMALNRAGLTVFVHPNTGDAITDHSDYVMWLGRSYDLHMDGLN